MNDIKLVLETITEVENVTINEAERKTSIEK